MLGPHPYRYQAAEDPRHPLALISPANNKMISSTLGEFNYPVLELSLHPTDAERRGITDGGTVRVFNGSAPPT